MSLMSDDWVKIEISEHDQITTNSFLGKTVLKKNLFIFWNSLKLKNLIDVAILVLHLIICILLIPIQNYLFYFVFVPILKK